MITLSDKKMLLNEREAAKSLGLSVSTLQQWRFQGRGPIYIKLGKAIRYRQQALDDFIASCSIRPTGR